MASQTVRNFMRQQGFTEEPSQVCDMHFAGLYFQPRIVGTLVLVGIILRPPASSVLFLALCAILWWNVSVPQLNPFEVFYNRVIAAPRRKTPLAPAPGPRRFAQGMAAAMMLIVALALWQNWMITARVFEGLIVVAFAALLFGKFCMGAYFYHLLRGEWAFANQTLPWAHQ
jgi:hypothetical protein